jgi:coenzyme F420 hydrogenase subunit beta
MGRTIKTIQDVVKWGLCTGCGSCFSECDKGAVTLVNIESAGIRPRFDSQSCASCTSCLSICPGYRVDAALATGPVAQPTHAEHEFGPALETWEGYAADSKIRFKASSGGMLSALALYCLEQEHAAFVLHSGIEKDRPWTNKTVQSRTSQDILACTGSRYAPASPCDDLGSIEDSDRPCVFIGKPCDAAATMMMRKTHPQLDRNLALVLTFFCAGTPSTGGTLELMKSMQVEPSQVTTVKYRGEGWPGTFRILGNGISNKSLTYDESWGLLTKHRPLRCNLCPDGLGRVSDIACGDAWEQHRRNPLDPGRSIILVRTKRGQEILHRAAAAGYVHIEPVTPQAVFEAQPNLLSRRRELFGRLLAMRLTVTPVPQFTGFSLFHSWMRLPLGEKFRTVAGTLRRIILHGWWKPHVDETQLRPSTTTNVIRCPYGVSDTLSKTDSGR